MKINVIFRIASHFVETRVAANKLSSCDDTVFSCVCVFGKFHPNRERFLLIPADRCHSGLMSVTCMKSGCFESESGRESRLSESHKNLWESDCFVATDLQSRVTSPVGCCCVCVCVHFTVCVWLIDHRRGTLMTSQIQRCICSRVPVPPKKIFRSSVTRC